MKYILILILFCGLTVDGFCNKIVIHPVPNALIYSKHNDDYTVRVRQPNGRWQDLYEFNVRVDMDKVQDASMVQFDFEGEVEIMVRLNNGLLQNVNIRPFTANIKPEVNGNTITFKINKPQKLSVEFNGNKRNNLHIFANELEKNVPAVNDPQVIYFGPGVHQPKDQPGIQFTIASNTIVYLAPGAVLKAKIVCHQVENVKIIGRGIILESQRGIEITNSKNITIDGITVINPDHYTVYGGQTTGLTINNLKSFSCKGWSDGIDLMSCSDVTINDVFMRNSDDCIAIYGHRWDYYGNAQNIHVTNAILWADIAHPINIGLHGNAENGGDTIANVTFRNINILEHDEDDPNYQGCMAITCSDNNLVKNILFENIDIDNIEEGQYFNFRVVFNEKYCKAPGRGIENVILRNVNCRGSGVNPSVIAGYDHDRGIRNVEIQDFTVNGKNVKDISQEAEIGPFVRMGSIKKLYFE